MWTTQVVTPMHMLILYTALLNQLCITACNISSTYECIYCIRVRNWASVSPLVVVKRCWSVPPYYVSSASKIW